MRLLMPRGCLQTIVAAAVAAEDESVLGAAAVTMKAALILLQAGEVLLAVAAAAAAAVAAAVSERITPALMLVVAAAAAVMAVAMATTINADQIHAASLDASGMRSATVVHAACGDVDLVATVIVICVPRTSRAAARVLEEAAHLCAVLFAVDAFLMGLRHGLHSCKISVPGAQSEGAPLGQRAGRRQRRGDSRRTSVCTTTPSASSTTPTPSTCTS